MKAKTWDCLTQLCGEIDTLRARIDELEKRQPVILINTVPEDNKAPWWVGAVKDSPRGN